MKLAPPTHLRRVAQIIVFMLPVRPFLPVFMGLSTRHRQICRSDPAIIVANHNSHLDTLSIMSQISLGLLWHVRPVAAADHFGTGILGHITRFILHAILIEITRTGGRRSSRSSPRWIRTRLSSSFQKGRAARPRFWHDSGVELPIWLKRDVTFH
jgi:1-acyl-sn-glycerol-3-phosphate acyltransferase